MILRGLSVCWDAFSGEPSRTLSREELDTIWVQELEGRSVPVRLRFSRPSAAGPRRDELHLSGFVGAVTLRCADAAVADKIDALMRMASYSGVGAQRQKGLGVVRLLEGGPAMARPA